MMVPRSYHFLHQPSSSAKSAPSSSTSPKSSSPPRRSSEKMGARITVTPVSSPNPSSQLHPPGGSDREPAPKPRQPSPTPSSEPTHSKPVVIPPRASSKSPLATHTVRLRGQNGGRRSRLPANHKADAIPPAVAALLALTEIPRMPPRMRRASSLRDRRISMDELIQEWNKEDADVPSSLGGSPLDLLLGRVDESEDEYGSLQSIEQDKGFLTSRSMSSDSLNTIPPSLVQDSPSLASNWDIPITPESYRAERRGKTVQSPPKEDCILDHPLLQFTEDEREDLANDMDTPDVVVTSPSPSAGRFQSFKSNLTASFQAMKSAAKSFSNFTAPSVPPDDLLTRSLLSPRFTSEMRPKNMQGLPSPALRRYLNPQPAPISYKELSMRLHSELRLDADSDVNAPMIQMQTYDRRGRSPNRKRKNDPFSEAGRAQSNSPAVRQREPRENSDFLRIIVMEMNMRRAGKLDAKAVGKARIWLPPRRSSASPATPVSPGGNGVPDRWVARGVDGE